MSIRYLRYYIYLLCQIKIIKETSTKMYYSICRKQKGGTIMLKFRYHNTTTIADFEGFILTVVIDDLY